AGNISSRKERRKEYRLAYMDHTYGIYNENYFLTVVRRRRMKSSRNVQYFATLDVDKTADNGGAVTVGYLELQKKVTSIVCETITARYKVTSTNNVSYGFRTSGTFLLYVEAKTQQAVLRELEDLNKQIAINIDQSGVGTPIKFRIGICEDIHEDKISVDELLSRCEIARNSNYLPLAGNIVIFESSMVQKTMDDLSLAKDIEHALQFHEFEVYYQPKFDLHSEKFVGAEALVRWKHPTKGLVSPGTFVPFAERNDQIIAIDRYCFERVCQDIGYWKKRGTRLLNISVNLSRNGVFRKDLISFYKDTMEKYEVNPLLLEIELTESAAQRDMLYLLSIIKQIKALKLKISIDDFGTGYSSLSNLRKLPMDTLKIDKSFFDSVEVDKKSRDIVKTTIAMAKALEMKVVAEGIQTAKQIALLKACDCDLVQGYYYSKPLSREEYEIFLKTNEFEHPKKG
ncbi:MAG: EAL domain-containing protein, partial [Bacilli bacterium]|nr:EAL domain-containing protein [Bacilli bacterium]